ncbi:hypothetical protein COEX109129_39375 [Corallococcus exiguus]
MKRPTMPSTPSSSAGRPATVAPKTTSPSPACRPSTSAQAPCASVFTVTCCRCAKPCTADVSSSVSCSVTSSWLLVPPFAPRASSGSRVGALTPFSASRQYASAFFVSCFPSHPMYSRYAGRVRPRTSPPVTSASYVVKTSSSTRPRLHPSSSRWWWLHTHRHPSSPSFITAMRISGAWPSSKPWRLSAFRYSSSACCCASRPRLLQSRSSHGSCTVRCTTCSGSSSPSQRKRVRRMDSRSTTACHACFSASTFSPPRTSHASCSTYTPLPPSSSEWKSRPCCNGESG